VPGHFCARIPAVLNPDSLALSIDDQFAGETAAMTRLTLVLTLFAAAGVASSKKVDE